MEYLKKKVCGRAVSGRCCGGRTGLAALLGALTLALGPVAEGRINVVTLPGRDSVQLTIYNSADLTLVKETRVLTFRRGLNRLEFSWANTLIDPTSVEFRALTHGEEVDVLDVSFPPRVTNTLEWRIQSEFAGEVRVEIRYFTSGIGWSADYLAEANTLEQAMTLAGHVRVSNESGEDYENAQVRLVVGVIRLVEEIKQLAQAGRPGDGIQEEALASKKTMVLGRAVSRMEAVTAPAAPAPKQIVKEGVSEYFLYTVEGRDTIPSGWSKRLPSFAAQGVPIVSYYKHEQERWGDQVVRFYRFKNDKESQLGNEPLPDGAVRAFRVISEDGLHSFVGSTAVKYIPVDEGVDLELGPDQEVMVEPKMMDWEKRDLQFDRNGDVSGWTIRESWEIALQNSKQIDVVLDVRRSFPGDWTLETASDYEKMDASKVKFVAPLKAGEKRVLKYDVTTRFGVNVVK